MEESDFYLAFSYAPGIGPKRLLDLVRVSGSAELAWNASEKMLEDAGLGDKTIHTFLDFKNIFNITKTMQGLDQEGIAFIAQNSDRYPQSLLNLPNPPIGLFIKGNGDLLKSGNSLAVVGSRKTTQYGREITNTLVSEASLEGMTIISGLALGIDAIAHMVCLDSSGNTIAVLGCGVDCCYPRENFIVYSRILKNNGLIISEYPPMTPPSKGSFPARNRIIAALSQGILVTEATEDSGSLITADWGRRLGRMIFAVPGPITSQNSYGTLGLIQKGAVLVRKTEDILQEISVYSSQFSKNSRQKRNLKLNTTQKKIYDLLDEEMEIDEIIRLTKFSSNKLNSILSEMELEGVIVVLGGKVKKVS